MDINKEILKGQVDMIILSLLIVKDMYGYELAKYIREISQEKFEIKEGTLYLALKRIEKNSLIDSYWIHHQGPGGKRKYYKITEIGEIEFQHKKKEWLFLRKIIDKFVVGGE